VRALDGSKRFHLGKAHHMDAPLPQTTWTLVILPGAAGGSEGRYELTGPMPRSNEHILMRSADGLERTFVVRSIAHVVSEAGTSEPVVEAVPANELSADVA
jgi:hypothetical protein